MLHIDSTKKKFFYAKIDFFLILVRIILILNMSELLYQLVSNIAGMVVGLNFETAILIIVSTMFSMLTTSICLRIVIPSHEMRCDIISRAISTAIMSVVACVTVFCLIVRYHG